MDQPASIWMGLGAREKAEKGQAGRDGRTGCLGGPDKNACERSGGCLCFPSPWARSASELTSTAEDAGIGYRLEPEQRVHRGRQSGLGWGGESWGKHAPWWAGGMGSGWGLAWGMSRVLGLGPRKGWWLGAGSAPGNGDRPKGEVSHIRHCRVMPWSLSH